VIGGEKMQIEIRDNYILIKGYVNAVERDSRRIPSPQGYFVEQVRSGVWQNAINNNDDIKILLNHDWNRKLGSTRDILSLREDNIGLYAEAQVSDNDVIEKAKNKQLVGWSFRFIPNKQSWGKTDDDNIQRRFLDDIDLLEVSILDNSKTPAYYGTSLETRDDKEVNIEQRFIHDQIEIVNHLEKSIEETRNIDNELELKLKLLELELAI
jgi:HK97 family phage prohead protease